MSSRSLPELSLCWEEQDEESTFQHSYSFTPSLNNLGHAVFCSQRESSFVKNNLKLKPFFFLTLLVHVIVPLVHNLSKSMTLNTEFFSPC